MGPAEIRLRQLAGSKRFVPLRGNTTASCVVVGEAPGAEEEAQGITFIGASGSLLTKMLGEAGFNTHDFWVTNVFKIRPPDNDLSRVSELGIPKEAFHDQFLEELYAYKPTIIICLGATALTYLCPDTVERKTGVSSISKWRGSLLSSPRLSWPHYVIPIIHPAAVLREWSERPIAVLCLAKAYEELAYLRAHGKLQELPSRQLLTSPSSGDVIDYLREAINGNDRVSNDIETIYGKYPYTISVARSPTSAISFSFWDYTGVSQVQIWRLLDAVLSNNPQIGQNYVGFDCHMLESLGFTTHVNLVDDTLVRHHVLWPEFEHKLQFLGMQYTRQPYWKDEGKLWKPSEGKDKLMRYNALDAACTYEVYLKQEEDFDDRPYLRNFYSQYEMRLDHSLYHVENRGLLVDTARLSNLRSHILREIDKYCNDAESVIGRPVAAVSECKHCPKKFCTCGIRSVKKIAKEKAIKQDEVFNLASPKQLIEEFQKRGIKVPKKKGKGGGGYTVDEEALLRIALNNNQEKLPDLVISIRELNKIRSTNVDAKLYENTLFCSYGTTGTDTGRRNSSENIFGFGGNMQNIPKHTKLGLMYRECLIARPGNIFIECDQKGAEDWIVQALIVDNGGSDTGLQELRGGVNRHRKLAAYLFSKPESEITKDEENPNFIWYYTGKKTRHAGNYGMQPEKFSVVLLTEARLNCPVAYTTWLLNKFHEFEPSIRGVFHEYVERTLSSSRTLITPLGRERVFFDLRPGSNNSDTFRKAYAFIPQSTVGDNTGMSIVWLHDHGFRVVADNHDAVGCEESDTDDRVFETVLGMAQSFDRELRFPNGTVVNIPVEFKIGYDQRNMVTIRNHQDRRDILQALQEVRDKRASTTCQDKSAHMVG